VTGFDQLEGAQPVSQDRLRKFEAAELDADQRAIYDVYAERHANAGASATSPLVQLMDDQGHLMGPTNAWLLNPVIGKGLQDLGVAVRVGPRLAPRLQEIVILVVSQRLDSPFERFAHGRIARTVGLSDEEIDGLLSGAPASFADELEQCAYDLASSMMDTGGLTDAEYARAVEVFGEQRLFDLTAIVGWYQMMALQLSVFRVMPPVESVD
jgi:4-carboxymuconolactone decarboxylase